MVWSGEQCGFVIETFFKNGDSVIAIQRAFRTHFQLGRRARVPSWNTILRWVDSVRATGSTLKKKPPGRPKTVCMAINLEAIRQSVLWSPQRSAHKHVVALRLSNTTPVRHLNSCINIQGHNVEDVVSHK